MRSIETDSNRLSLSNGAERLVELKLHGKEFSVMQATLWTGFVTAIALVASTRHRDGVK
jgi:hypothetical protein